MLTLVQSQFVLIGVGLVASVASHASAVVVTFDTYPGPDGQLRTVDDVPVGLSSPMLSTEYESVGLLFHSIRETVGTYQNKILDIGAFGNPPGPTQHVLSAAINPEYSGIYTGISGTFAVPVRSVSMRVVGTASVFVGGVGLDGVERFRTAEIANDVVTFDDFGTIGGFGVSTPSTSTTFGYTVAIDDLTFTAVPEPATATVVLGMIGTLASRRRRSR